MEMHGSRRLLVRRLYFDEKLPFSFSCRCHQISLKCRVRRESEFLKSIRRARSVVKAAQHNVPLSVECREDSRTVLKLIFAATSLRRTLSTTLKRHGNGKEPVIAARPCLLLLPICIVQVVFEGFFTRFQVRCLFESVLSVSNLTQFVRVTLRGGSVPYASQAFHSSDGKQNVTWYCRRDPLNPRNCFLSKLAKVECECWSSRDNIGCVGRSKESRKVQRTCT